MFAKLIATVAVLGIAGAAAAHTPVNARPAAHIAALDSIIGEVQLDALIARIVPPDAKHLAAGHHAAATLPGKARERG